jgi:hypothetical protein
LQITSGTPHPDRDDFFRNHPKKSVGFFAGIRRGPGLNTGIAVFPISAFFEKRKTE